ncbi:MAG: hypothetical protein FJ088_14095, partial [Deltaproteobacteria bacterium]|nr:hypothetical protein [Deltaproteobacteria bacterium]
KNPLFSAEFSSSFSLLGFYTLERNFINNYILYDPQAQKFMTEDYLRLSEDGGYFSFLFRTAFDAEMSDFLSFSLVFDTGQLRMTRVPGEFRTQQGLYLFSTETKEVFTSSGRDVSDEFLETLFIRDIHADIAFARNDWLSLTAGKFFQEMGGSLIFNDLHLGARIRADLEILSGTPFKAEISAGFPAGFGRGYNFDSPISYLKLEYPITFFNSISIFGAWFRDQGDEIANIVSSYLIESFAEIKNPLPLIFALTTPFKSRGDIFWYGSSVSLMPLEDLFLYASFIVESGYFEIEYMNLSGNIIRKDVELNSFAADARISYERQSFDAAFSFLYLRGEKLKDTKQEEARSAKMEGFISVVPYITRSNIFFNGGLNENFAARSVSSSGINGRGVIAPALEIGASPLETLYLKTKNSFLWSDTPSMQTGGGFYGFP